MAFFLFSALWTRKMNLALISEIMQAFWAYVKGDARTHLYWQSHAVWHAGALLFMNYFREVLELSELKARGQKHWKTELMLKS